MAKENLKEYEATESVKIRTEHTTGQWHKKGNKVKLDLDTARCYRKYLKPDPGPRPLADPDPRRPDIEERRAVRKSAAKAAAEEMAKRRKETEAKAKKEAAAKSKAAAKKEDANAEVSEPEAEKAEA